MPVNSKMRSKDLVTGISKSIAPTFTITEAETAPSEKTHEEHIVPTSGFRIPIQINNSSNVFEASSDDIAQVFNSALISIFKHIKSDADDFCLPGVHVFAKEDSPITLFQPREDGHVAIGITARQTYWCQYAFQFAHEFCHTIVGHTHKETRDRLETSLTANDWLEESLCEVASLFALRAMAKDWQVSPPFPHWQGFAKHLSAYADKRLEETLSCWREQPHTSLADWLKDNESCMREDSCVRQLNNIIAMKLLPHFERNPHGWDSLRYFKRQPLYRSASLQEHFQTWIASVNSSLHAHPEAGNFVRGLAIELGVL